MPMPILPIIIILLLGCTEQDSYIIRVEKDAIFFGKKKIANTADVASQDSLFVEALRKAFESKKDTSKSCQIKIDPELSYDVLYKIATTCRSSDRTDISIVYKIDEENYDIPFSVYGWGEFYKIVFPEPYLMPDDNGNLDLAIDIDDDYFEIWARGGTLPKMFFNENLDSSCNELSSALIKIHNRFGNSPFYVLEDIHAHKDIKISFVILAIHSLRSAGFTQINLILKDKKTESESDSLDWGKINEIIKEIRESNGFKKPSYLTPNK
jgi:biopolymer transport protein ExbD